MSVLVHLPFLHILILVSWLLNHVSYTLIYYRIVVSSFNALIYWSKYLNRVMIVFGYDSTMEHSSLRFAEYTQHTEDTTYYLFINSTYLAWKCLYSKYTKIQESIWPLFFMRRTNIETHVMCKPTYYQ